MTHEAVAPPIVSVDLKHVQAYLHCDEPRWKDPIAWSPWHTVITSHYITFIQLRLPSKATYIECILQWRFNPESVRITQVHDMYHLSKVLRYRNKRYQTKISSPIPKVTMEPRWAFDLERHHRYTGWLRKAPMVWLMCVRVCVCMSACVHSSMYMGLCACIGVCERVCVCLCVCVCVCVCGRPELSSP